MIQLLQSLKPLLCSMLCSSRCQQSLLLLHVMLTLPLTGSESLLKYLVRNMMSDYGCSYALLCKLTTFVGKFSATSDRRTACQHHQLDRPGLVRHLSLDAHEQHCCRAICLISYHPWST